MFWEKADTDRFVRLLAKAPERPSFAGEWSRRRIMQMASGAVAAGALWDGSVRPANALVREESPGIKLTQLCRLDADADQMLFLKQCGYTHVFGNVEKMMSADELKAAKKHFADGGLTLGNVRYHYENVSDILLNTPKRDAAIADQILWLKNSGEAGFDYTGSSLALFSIWASEPTTTRGARTREFNYDSPNLHIGGAPKDIVGRDTPVAGRVYTREEVLGNFSKYYVPTVVPAAEQAGIFIGFHPDDVPVYDNLGGLPRIFGTMDKVKHIFDLAHDSPNIGIMMCCGTWAEGGDKMGATVTEALRYLWGRKKYREIHFRNISSPLPKFHETFMDNGYFDMYQIMKTLVDLGYNHNVNLDHVPAMVGGQNSYIAWAAGYMKACWERAMIDSGKPWPTEKS